MACQEAGLPDKLVHDMRRTAIRHFNRMGIPDRVAMALAGHKTRSVYDRYNIVSKEDLKEAAKRLDQAAEPRMEDSGHTFGHTGLCRFSNFAPKCLKRFMRPG